MADEATDLSQDPASKSLRSMISDAMSRSKGQGVIQGSTMFFKNLAESVAQSNRNLKIGLAFLTATFVIVAVSLGYLVFTALKTQTQQGVDLEQKMKALDTETKKLVQPFYDEVKRLEASIGQKDAENRSQIEALRAENQQLVQQAQQASQQASRAEQRIVDLEKTISQYQELFARKLGEVNERVKALEGRGKKPGGSE